MHWFREIAIHGHPTRYEQECAEADERLRAESDRVRRFMRPDGIEIVIRRVAHFDPDVRIETDA